MQEYCACQTTKVIITTLNTRAITFSTVHLPVKWGKWLHDERRRRSDHMFPRSLVDFLKACDQIQRQRDMWSYQIGVLPSLSTGFQDLTSFLKTLYLCRFSSSSSSSSSFLFYVYMKCVFIIKEKQSQEIRNRASGKWAKVSNLSMYFSTIYIYIQVGRFVHVLLFFFFFWIMQQLK